MKGFIRSTKTIRSRATHSLAVLAVVGGAFMGQGVAQAAVTHPTPTAHPGNYYNAPAGSITGHKISH